MVHRVYRHFNETTTIEPLSHKIPRLHTGILDTNLESFVVGFVLEHPEVYLSELSQKVEVYGARVSTSTLFRLLRRHGIMHKKVQQIVLQ